MDQKTNPLRKLRGATLLLVSGLALMAVIYVLLLRPHEQLEFVRTSGQLEKITVEYVAFACSDYYPRLYEHTANRAVARGARPVLLALPEGLPSPEDTEYAIDGNLFELVGYRSHLRRTDRITGSRVEGPSQRVDVVSWKLLPPYKMWSGKKDIQGTPMKETGTSPIEYGSDVAERAPDGFVLRKYDACP